MDTLTAFTVLMAVATVFLAVVSAISVYFAARHQWLTGLPKLMVGALLDQGEVEVKLFNFGPVPVTIFQVVVVTSRSCKGRMQSVAAQPVGRRVVPGEGWGMRFKAERLPEKGEKIFLLVETGHAGTLGVWSQCAFEMKPDGRGSYRIAKPTPEFCLGDFSAWWYLLCCYCKTLGDLVSRAFGILASCFSACGDTKKKNADGQEGEAEKAGR